jgi:hypothetical protein
MPSSFSSGVLASRVQFFSSEDASILKAVGEFDDQGDAKWIGWSLWGHNDWPTGRPGSGRPQVVFGGLSYY